MIKLIASDLDGTILQNGAQSVDKSLIECIGKLVNAGIIFAPASGRQMTSLRRLFEPVSDKLMYISENGAYVKYKDDVIVKDAMDRKLAMDIINDVYSMDNCELLISGEHTAYIKPKSAQYLHRMTKVVNYHCTLVDDFSQIDEDIVKIAVCDQTGIDNSKEYLINTWGSRAQAVVSGDLYLDYMALGVNKGHGMKQIQDKLGISPDECIAFGDNYNDLELLDSVSHSYVMNNAVDDVKKHGKHISMLVETTLRDLFPDILG